MGTTGFQSWEHATHTVRLIAQGALDRDLDRIASAISGRRFTISRADERQANKMDSELVLPGPVLRQSRAAEFAPGDLVRVESRQAKYRQHGVVGVVKKVNESTVHVVRADHSLRTGDKYIAAWERSNLTKFQKLKGFIVRKEHLIHVV